MTKKTEGHKRESGQIHLAVSESKQWKKDTTNVSRINEYVYKVLDLK